MCHSEWLQTTWSGVFLHLICFELPSQSRDNMQLWNVKAADEYAWTGPNSTVLWNTEFISNIHQSIWLSLKGLPASPSITPPATHDPCFRHVLVIIKHNNGFYKSPFASLVMWIIQPKREREGEECCSSQVGLAPEMAGDRWGILSELFILFSSTFYNCHIVFFFTLLFPPTPSASVFPLLTPNHTHTYTHTPSRLFQAALITVAQAVKLSSDD